MPASSSSHHYNAEWSDSDDDSSTSSTASIQPLYTPSLRSSALAAKFSPEVIGMTLELALDDPKWLSHKYWATREHARKRRYKFLRGASLVSRKWSLEARRLLWQHVVVKKGHQDQERLEEVLGSAGFGKHATVSMFLDGHAYGRDREGKKGMPTFKRLFEGIKGLESLCVESMTFKCQADYKFFSWPIFTTLKALTLRHVHFEGPKRDYEFALHFPLPALRILSITYSDIELMTCYTQFITPSLTHFELRSRSRDHTTDDLAAFLRLNSSHLVHLTIPTHSEKNITRAIGSCSNLHTLHLTIGDADELQPLFRRLSSQTPLRILKLVTWTREDLSEWVAALTAIFKMPGLARVEVLDFSTTILTEPMFKRAKKGNAFLKLLRQRNVEILFGDKKTGTEEDRRKWEAEYPRLPFVSMVRRVWDL